MIKVLKNKNDEKHARVGAAVALGMLKNRIAVDTLINTLKDKTEDAQLRIAAVTALGNIGEERAMGPIKEALKDPSDYVRNAAQSALNKMGK